MISPKIHEANRRPKDTVIIVFWRFCGGPWLKLTGSKAKDLFIYMPAPPHSLHVLIRRWCGQMLPPCMCSTPALLASVPSALVLTDARPPALLACAPEALCWQMPALPHYLHRSLSRRCGQTLGSVLCSAACFSTFSVAIFFWQSGICGGKCRMARWR